MLEGTTSVGAGSVIGPDARLIDTVVGRGATISYSVAKEAEIGPPSADVQEWAAEIFRDAEAIAVNERTTEDRREGSGSAWHADKAS